MSAVPKLRFPEFEGEWSLQSLGAVSEKPFYGMNSEATSYDGYNKYIRITDIDETTRKFGASAITSPAGGADKRYKLGEGDIVFARTGASVGKSYLYNKDDGDLFFAGFLIKFHIQKAYPKFVFFYTLTSQYGRWVIVNSARSGQPGINAEEYKSLEIPSPTLPEQQKIASFLSAVDKKIDLLRQKKDTLELYKKGLMQKIFSQEIRFKQDDGSDFPDWEEKKVREICTFSKGKGISKADISEGGSLPCIRYGELYTHYSVKIDKVISRTNIPAEKLVISGGGEVIIPASGEKPEDIATASVVMDKGVALGGDLNIIKTSADGYFLASYFSSEARSRLASLAQGNSVVHLYSNQIASLVISLPSLSEQQKIASFLMAFDAKIQKTSSLLDQMETFKKGLLQQMFV